MNNKILALVVLLTVGTTTYAYAEESVVQVPFQSHGQSCTFDEIAIEYQCVWQGIRDVFTIEDLKEFKAVLSNEIYDQELARLTEEALAEIAVEQAKLTPLELKIQKLGDKLDRGVANTDDSVLYHLLKQLDTCTQGMDKTTAPFQSPREITMSSFDKWSYNHIEYKGEIGYIVKAIEECRAQTTLLSVVGAGYENMLTGEDDYQFSLQDKFTSDIQSVPYDKYTRTTMNIDRSAICDNNQFADTQKAQFGCKVLYDGKTVAEIERENQIRFGTNGKINYQSQVLDDFMDFKETYGNYQATADDKKVQELIAEPIANEWKKDHNFYQNHLED
jgi:hypothetical protein